MDEPTGGSWVTIQLGTLVAELGDAGAGINRAVRGIVRTGGGDVEAFVKRLADIREILVEVACAHLARRLGLPVPEPVVVFVPEYLGGPNLAFGSVAVRAPNLSTFLATSEGRAVATRLKAWKHLLSAACFDEWITNCDRHDQNVLYSGGEDFWLIDHGLSVHAQLAVDQLSPRNMLFDIAVEGLPETELLRLRPQAANLMEGYAAHPVEDVKSALPDPIWDDDTLDSVFVWLEARQDHLVRLGSERIPARQSEFGYGRDA